MTWVLVLVFGGASWVGTPIPMRDKVACVAALHVAYAKTAAKDSSVCIDQFTGEVIVAK